MTKELQERAWASLPKEAREEIRLIFFMPSKYDYPQSIRKCLLDIYGDNITSDTEPEELEPFTEPTPKFNAGYKVKIVEKAIVTFGNTATIQGYAGKESENMYWVDDKIGLYSESQIESYTEENKE